MLVDLTEFWKNIAFAKIKPSQKVGILLLD
jgi:hypothetical protein